MRSARIWVLACAFGLGHGFGSATAVHADDGAAVVHVVLVWLAEPGNQAHRDAVVEATRGFASFSGVVEIRVGGPLPSDRPTVDDSFDVGLYIVFESAAALAAYQSNPAHLEAVRTVLRPLAARSVVYDFVDAPR